LTSFRTDGKSNGWADGGRRSVVADAGPGCIFTATTERRPPKMKSYRKELWFEAKQRRELVRITEQVEACVRDSGVREGIVLVNAMHITASVFINDNESGLHRDFERWLEKLAPEKPHSQYEHNGYEDNADAHLKRTIMGREVVIAITNGKLDFGPWEEIFYGEFDGKRQKRVLVKIIGE
jgi:secondary thiamine-phosphate synthase enzyme